MKRLGALQRLLTEVLEVNVHGKPWALVFHHLNVTNVATFARLDRTSLEETFYWDPLGASGAIVVATTLDAHEVDTLVDMQEWVRTNRNSMTAEWMLKDPDDFAIFRMDCYRPQQELAPQHSSRR
jgi:hypothetical protein